MLRQLLSRPFTPANVNSYPYTYRSFTPATSAIGGQSPSGSTSSEGSDNHHHHHHYRGDQYLYQHQPHQHSPPSPAHLGGSGATGYDQYDLRHSSWSSPAASSSSSSSSSQRSSYYDHHPQNSTTSAFNGHTSSPVTTDLETEDDYDDDELDTTSRPLDLSPRSRPQFEPDPALTAEDVLIQHEKSRQLRQQTIQFDDGRSRS